MEFRYFCWKADKTGICEAMLKWGWDEIMFVLAYERISELPTGLLEPLHDGSYAYSRIPGGESERSEGFTLSLSKGEAFQVHFTCIWLQENVIADEEDERGGGVFHAGVSRYPLMGFLNLDICDGAWGVGPACPAGRRGVWKKSCSFIVMTITHDDHLQFIAHGLHIEVLQALFQDAGPAMSGDDDGERGHRGSV
jgi:hypothetical protein